MKREAIGNTKMKRLCRCLGIRTFEAVGILESLWHLTAREAPQGDIGKLSDEDIALSIDYDGDEVKLIQALCDSRWLDRSSLYRLVIHDWHEHADDPSRRGYLESKRSRRWQRLKAAGGELAQSVRAFVFERDGKRCVTCGSLRDLTIDHKRPISKGGTNATDNLQSLCRACNGGKKDRFPAGAVQ